MDKSPDAFRTISEVAEHLETPAHVLRFWESRFPQIRPVKRAGGRRYYRPSDVSLLTGIKRLLHDEGMTIRGVQKILREQGVRHVVGLSGDAAPDVPEAGFYDDAEVIEIVETPRNVDPVPLRPTSGLADAMAKAVDPRPTDPRPTDPRPTDPRPTDSGPTDSGPAAPVVESPPVPVQGALLLTPAPTTAEANDGRGDAETQDVAAQAEAEDKQQAAGHEAAAIDPSVVAESSADADGIEEDDFDDGPTVTLATRIRALPEGASVAAVGTEFLAAVTRLQALRDRMVEATQSRQT